MKIKKDGLVIYNSIDNTGSTDDASLGARYAKGRLDSTDNNLHANYYTKDEVQELISGMGRTNIVPSLYEDWYVYVPTEATTDEEIYYQVSNSVLVDNPDLDDLHTYYRNWYEEETTKVPVEYFISCAEDTILVEDYEYYTVSFAGPGPKSTLIRNYVRQKIDIEPNTYYFVGNDNDGYLLYYYDANLREAKLGDFEIDFSQYAMKARAIGSYTLENDITAQNIQDDIKDLTAELTNKTVDADDNTIKNIIVSNFKTGVVKTSMPETPVDTELLSAKAIDEAKQDKLTAGTAITTVEDATTVSQIDLTNKKSSPISALNIWTYIKGKFTASTVSTVEDATTIADVNTSNANPVSRFTAATLWTYIKGKMTGAVSTVTTSNLTASRAVVANSSGKIAVSSTTSTELGYVHGVTSAIQTQINEMWKKIYPVGAIYISTSSSSPATLFGGTWERINGRFLVGAGSNGASGDELLNLTAGRTGGVYRHQHSYGIRYGAYYGQPTSTDDATALQLKTWNSSNTQSWSKGSQNGNVQGRYSSWSGDGSVSNFEHSANTKFVDNLPPYLAVYMWKRTA